MKEIFIVEDDTDIRELIEFLLEDNYKVKSFPSAGAFNNSISFQQPDLILLDIMLPDGNRLEICGRIKSEAGTSSIPVILMSAHMDKKILSDSGADDFIAKPFDIDELTARIKLQLA